MLQDDFLRFFIAFIDDPLYFGVNEGLYRLTVMCLMADVPSLEETLRFAGSFFDSQKNHSFKKKSVYNTKQK